jgi:hypothetical protein
LQDPRPEGLFGLLADGTPAPETELPSTGVGICDGEVVVERVYRQPQLRHTGKYGIGGECRWQPTPD